MSSLSVLRLVFTAFWVVAFAYAALASRDFSANSGVFPGVIALIGLAIALAALVSAVRVARREQASAPAAPTAAQIPSGAGIAAPEVPDSGELDPVSEASVHEQPVDFVRSARYGAWLLGLVLGIWLVGAVIAAGLFVALFLKVEARAGWKWVIAGPVLMIVGLVALANAVNLYWPETLLRL